MRKTIVPLGIFLLFLSTSVIEAKEKMALSRDKNNPH
jgi:hypothetical protein